ncbi:ABC transporter ATP-binding protein [Pseudorhodobacter turbinis]|uniref:ABC transporter ATP-binding protein n=1 Tax=Pseudorhodobacter turbinis TaxID=2500533 RepID=A0A4P8EFB2_9RHOB|nr:ABC transporter ATP-binding protein [Pseudorhodobacter turbinis]QCO55449.1 ABC transporter ATP-binding protein [Pseudorhodobacter turbinis]
MPLIEARNINIRIPTEDGMLYAAKNISFSVEAGSLFGIAGESGSGKSVLTQAIMGLLPGVEIEGECLFDGRDMLQITEAERRALRGKHIGMVFQDPMSSLHPYYSIGQQITEVIHTHETVSKRDAQSRAAEMLTKVGIQDAEDRLDDYPHQFSGGMRQRVMIAMALVLRPALIIADEPTTALDVTVQAQIMALLGQMRHELGVTIIMITHDLGLLSSIADHVMVMYAGSPLEIGPANAVFRAPSHPYTMGLLRSSPGAADSRNALVSIAGRPPSLLARPHACIFAPRCDQVAAICRTDPPPLRLYSDGTAALCHFEAKLPAPGNPKQAAPKPAQQAATLLKVKDVRLTYKIKSGFARARELEVLKGISLNVARGETLGIVGESGCGKSTLARAIAGLIPITSGNISFDGQDVGSLTAPEWRAMRKRVQVVFQDPYGSLNPRRRVGAIIGEPFRIHNLASGAVRKREVCQLMELVGLNPEHYNRFPSEFSGGQRQRIGVARALALQPDLLILDEPVSALDVSIQAQILNLMQDIQDEMGLTYLFISHDLTVVRHMCDTIAVMDGGRIIEMAKTEDIFNSPREDYTRTLLAASHVPPTPTLDTDRKLLEIIDGGTA